MHVLCVGISHKTASVELRERIAMNEAAAAEALRELAELFDGSELAILSTCNRTEIYAARPLHGHPRAEEVVSYLADRFEVTEGELASVCYHHDNERAVRHLMRVASGLDSMVLGEEQVLGQVRTTYRMAQDAGTVGPVLHHLFQATLSIGKRVRSETALSAGRTSVSAVAVDFARHLFQSFADKTVLTLGAGKMTELTLRHFSELKPGRVMICNRTAARAEDLADRFGGTAVAYEALDEHLIEADVVISSTGAKQPIVDAARFRPLLKRRRFRPIFIIDIAVPRDFDPAVRELAGVYLYDLDDLQKTLAEHAGARGGEVSAAESLVEPAVAACYAAIQTDDFSELIKRLRQKLQTIGSAESQRTINKLLGPAGEATDAQRVRDLIDEHTHRLINKILHRPLNALGRDTSGPEAAMFATALRRLFELDDHAEAAPESEPAKRAEP